MSRRPERHPGRRPISPVIRRILAVNILAVMVLGVGLLYLGEYRAGLIDAELAALRTQADLFAAALGEGATSSEAPGEEELIQAVAHQMVRRLVAATATRARLFADDGTLISDSQLLVGPGGLVQIEELPPPPTDGEFLSVFLNTYDRLAKRLWAGDELPVYRERANPTAPDYAEVMEALAGEAADAVYAAPQEGLVLSVTAPVQRYKSVLGALMLTKDGRDIDAALLEVRLNILKVFAVALTVTVLLSIYLASTIARPLLRLVAAAERVRRGRNHQHTIPDFGDRGDEIGVLSAALRDMTEALWSRMDAIEGFAADVAHEIKNPLSSLRSAVETAARVNNPEKQRRLLNIIQDDVQRLDRLITDISNASRLDAELSRAEAAPVEVGRMLATLVDLTEAAAESRDIRLKLDIPNDDDLIVNGMESRLVQVFRNLLANAISFSPAGGVITLRARRDNSTVEAEILDQGPGIPEGKEDAIFSRFYSERPPDEKFGTHSGLGLSISKQIVDAHGGLIAAENRHIREDGAPGARFIVRLPAT